MTTPQSIKSQLKLGVVILGAGASSRMGRPKLLLPWDNTSVVGHLIRQWESLNANQIAIVCRSNDEALHAELDRLDFPKRNRITNPQPERGMFSSILCAANWDGWNDELTAWAIVLGDQPHLRPDTLRGLLSFYRKYTDAICQPAHNGHARHPVLLPRSAFAELRIAHAETLKDFLENTTCRIVEHPMSDPGLTLDLNRPEDYEWAVKLNSRIV